MNRKNIIVIKVIDGFSLTLQSELIHSLFFLGLQHLYVRVWRLLASKCIWILLNPSTFKGIYIIP